MIPLLIERDFDIIHGEDSIALSQIVRSDLEKLLSTNIREGFARTLLDARRLLIVVDHYSEMRADTRRLLAPDRPESPLAAMVITSRHEERLGDVPKSTLRPIRVSGDYLFEFVSAYLRANQARGDFTDKEFAEACGNISDILSGREATVLLVKLCCERLIESKKKNRGGDSSPALPGDVPSLMVAYLVDLNSSIPDGLPPERVIEDVLTVAWMCVREEFIPRSCRRDAALQALAQIDNAEPSARLEYMERRLGLLELQNGLFTTIRFNLDPLAEYWAALHVVRCFEEDRFERRQFVKQLHEMASVNTRPVGFFAALRDCVKVYSSTERSSHPHLDTLSQALQQMVLHSVDRSDPRG